MEDPIVENQTESPRGSSSPEAAGENLSEKNLSEKNLSRKNPPKKSSSEKSSPEKNLPEKRAAGGGRALAKSHLEKGQDLLPVFLSRFDREETRRAYRADLEAFFRAGAVDLSLAREATFLHVNDHLRKLSEQGLRPATIRRRIAAIRGFFSWLLALEVIEANPAEKELTRSVRSGAGGRKRQVDVLSEAQAGALLEATTEAGEAAARDRAIIKTLLYCVLRRSEAAAMDVAHVRPLSHYWVLDLPVAKGGSGEYVKIPAKVVEEIDRMKETYGIEEGPLWRSFSNRNRGDRITPQSVYRIVRRTARRAGLPDIGAHVLRHTGCTLAIESGASLRQVKTHARHENVETTMVYLHQRDKLSDSAADHIRVPDGD